MRTALWPAIIASLLSGGVARAGSFVDDTATFSLAMSALRGAIGQHARALRIAGDGVEIQAQDPHSPKHFPLRDHHRHARDSARDWTCNHQLFRAR